MSNVHFILRGNPSTRALAPYFSRRIRSASPLTSATCHKSVRSWRDLRLDHPLMASFFSAQLGFCLFDLFFSQVSSGCGGELSRVEVLGCESDVSKFTVGETLPSVSHFAPVRLSYSFLGLHLTHWSSFGLDWTHLPSAIFRIIRCRTCCRLEVSLRPLHLWMPVRAWWYSYSRVFILFLSCSKFLLVVNPSSALLLKTFLRIWLHKVFLRETGTNFKDSFCAPQQSSSMFVSSTPVDSGAK